MTDQKVDDFLEHYGVLGMKWGVRNERRAIRKASDQELKKLVKRNTAAQNLTRKDPTFKREVKATKKKKVLEVEPVLKKQRLVVYLQDVF